MKIRRAGLLGLLVIAAILSLVMPVQAAAPKRPASQVAVQATPIPLQPTIGITGITSGFLSSDDSSGVANQPTLTELGISIRSAIDPLTDVTVNMSFLDRFGVQTFSMEEGFVTVRDLPGAWTARVGRIRAPLGELNQRYQEQVPLNGRPFTLTENFGNSLFSSSGLELTRPVEIPFLVKSDFALALMHNGFGPFNMLIPSSVGVARLRGTAELSRDHRARFGLSAAVGANRYDATSWLFDFSLSTLRGWGAGRETFGDSDFILGLFQTPGGVLRTISAFSAVGFRPNSETELGFIVDHGEHAEFKTYESRIGPYFAHQFRDGLKGAFQLERYTASFISGYEYRSIIQITFQAGARRSRAF